MTSLNNKMFALATHTGLKLFFRPQNLISHFRDMRSYVKYCLWICYLFLLPLSSRKWYHQVSNPLVVPNLLQDQYLADLQLQGNSTKSMYLGQTDSELY